MKELERLQKENDDLRAKLDVSLVSEESLRLAIKSMELAKKENSGYEPSLSVYQREVDNLISLASKRPAQSLAEIKADAVMSIMDNVDDFEAFGSPKMMEVKDIIEYASRIKEG